MLNMKKKVIISVDVDYFPKSESGIFRLLDLFDQMDIKGMFFVAGKYAEENDGIITQIHKRGHEIGCHGYSHGLDIDENFVDLQEDEQRRRLEKSSEILKGITGENVRIFRAPYAKANHITLRVLEGLGYECDSSVHSMRFDFGMGVSNNVRGFFAPRKPYHPSKDSLFKEGGSEVIEVPISAFVVPLTLTAIRTFGVGRIGHVFNLSSHFFDPILFYLHPWEVMETDEIQLWDGLPKRHRMNRGEKALSDLRTFLNLIEKRVDFIQFRDILESG
jgi:peptidoglycan/xylan/chitin deacetylase (PgdA/CDA1 family)